MLHERELIEALESCFGWGGGRRSKQLVVAAALHRAASSWASWRLRFNAKLAAFSSSLRVEAAEEAGSEEEDAEAEEPAECSERTASSSSSVSLISSGEAGLPRAGESFTAESLEPTDLDGRRMEKLLESSSGSSSSVEESERAIGATRVGP